jgi:hypothetical protein
MFMLWVGVQDFAVNQFSLINISLLMKVKGKLKFLVGHAVFSHCNLPWFKAKSISSSGFQTNLAGKAGGTGNKKAKGGALSSLVFKIERGREKRI